MNFWRILIGITLLQLVVWFMICWFLDKSNRKQPFEDYPVQSVFAYSIVSLFATIVMDMVIIGVYLICS